MNENTSTSNSNFSKEKSLTGSLTRSQNSFQKKSNAEGLGAKPPASASSLKGTSKATNSRNNNSKKLATTSTRGVRGRSPQPFRRRKVLSVSQLLVRVQKQKQRQLTQKKRQKPIKPIIPPKSLIIILKDKPEKAIYNRRIIDYKHCGLLQRYIGLGGKILPRRQTKLTAKQQRYIAKTIKSARIMGLLPFVTKERGFFR
uniref:Small ribosomal subunit protein bS18c n=1 Tax=Ourococcus multisporus TaxID=132186 RepID=A0A140GIX4_9CHLO|nr:ribosomal protein S18 [Ourococcus multisporus]